MNKKQDTKKKDEEKAEETKEEEKPQESEVVEPVAEEKVRVRKKKLFDKESWKPKTNLGNKVKSGEITNIDDVLDNGLKILEQEIVEALLPDMETDLLMIGQSKGKFGGGQRRVFKQTQKKTQEGNKPSFATLAVIGNKNGYVGVGYGKAKETVPAREKAIRKAKLNIIKIRRGCGSWACGCGNPHTIPVKVNGKCSSVKIELMPAPKGTGLVVEKETRKMLHLAGIKDVYSRTSGHTKTKLNLIYAVFAALKKLNKVKIKQDYYKQSGLIEGKLDVK